MKRIALIIIAASIAAAGWIAWLQREENAHQVSGELKTYGNVEIREVPLSFRVGGRVESLAFEEGDAVRKGDVVATLDDAQYAIALRGAEAALAAAESAASKLRAGYEDDVIQAARAARDEAAASLRNAEKNRERFKALLEQNVVAQKEYDDVSTAVDRLRAALSAAESRLHQLRGGFRDEDVRAAEAQVDAARAALDAAATSLSDTKLIAPADGVLLTRVCEPGTMAAPGMPVCLMMLKSPLQVRAYVSEIQLGRIKLGMRAKVYVDSYPDEPIDATVSFIASEAEFTPKQVQTEDMRINLVYRVRLLVQDDARGILKNGMPVTVVLEEEGA